MAKYKKAPAYEGKDLNLHLGRGDMKIEDGVEYSEPRLARYVPEFMVEVTGEEKKAPAKKAPVAKDESELYTEADLNKNNKGDLVQLALDDFSLELDPDLKKAEMVAAILEKQGE